MPPYPAAAPSPPSSAAGAMLATGTWLAGALPAAVPVLPAAPAAAHAASHTGVLPSATNQHTPLAAPCMHAWQLQPPPATALASPSPPSTPFMLEHQLLQQDALASALQCLGCIAAGCHRHHPRSHRRHYPQLLPWSCQHVVCLDSKRICWGL
jgi:hypothetical protein